SVACALLYWLAGLSGFEAVIHAMTTVATGGFSTADASLAAFKNPWAEIIAIVFMMLGGVSFTLFLRILQGDRRAMLTDGQVRIYFAAAAAASLAVALWLWLEAGEHPLTALRYGAFNVVSVMTTTGYASSDYGQFGALPMVLFAVLMLIGGCSGSTTGGIKVFRFQILFEVSRAHVRHALLPSGVFVPKYNRRHITDQVTHSVVSFMFLYGLTIAVLAAGLGFYGLDIVTAFSGAASAVSNLGPGLGNVIGPAGNFASLPEGAKWMLSFGMLLGRLELVTVLVLLSRGFWRM
ncbi:MAG TPA: potassium transporter TrkG, partial [Alphaproteobacteria bacterium]|nr:potassium transporter TrkG [Alphaproteobacteria bacterium]